MAQKQVRAQAHYIFASGPAHSHCQPFFNLALELLTHTPDLVVSYIVHHSNIALCRALLDAKDTGLVLTERLNLLVCGEGKEGEHVANATMTMIYEAGAKYASALTNPDLPKATHFIADLSSFYYHAIKLGVEAKLSSMGLSAFPKYVAYVPESLAETVLLAGDEKNGSLRWVEQALESEGQVDSVSTTMNNLLGDKPSASPLTLNEDPQLKARNVEAFRKYLTENDREVHIPGSSPYYLYERWAESVDWSSPMNYHWTKYLSGVQGAAEQATAWIQCWPASIFEPETLEAAQQDPYIGNGGSKRWLEVGWFETPKTPSWEDEVSKWLDRFEARQVIYVSFGTIVDAGTALSALLGYLSDSGLPFLYARGGQAAELPQDIQDILSTCEARGRALSVKWVNQVDVLNHPSILAFVTHAGLNSFMESVLAGVPMIAWPHRGDQVSNAALIHSEKLGVELIQCRTGYNVSRPVLYRNEKVEGSSEALVKDLARAIEQIRGSEGQVFRENLGKKAGEIRRQRGDKWLSAVKELGQWGRA